MKIIRKLIDFCLSTPKCSVYLCQSTTKKYKNQLEISGDFTLSIYLSNNKLYKFDKVSVLYIKNST